MFTQKISMTNVWQGSKYTSGMPHYNIRCGNPVLIFQNPYADTLKMFISQNTQVRDLGGWSQLYRSGACLCSLSIYTLYDDQHFWSSWKVRNVKKTKYT